MMKYLLILPIAYVLGFFAFLAVLPATPSHVASADGIVVLTGGDARLDAAVALLEQRRAKRLLITGVNPSTTRSDLKRISHGGKRFDCCADLGYAAMSTHGNAAEAASWTRENRYKSLIVVTARYHMPRSLTEFQANMRDVRLEPYPVDPADLNIKQWWHNPRVLNLLHGEYAKYLASIVMTKLIGPDEPRHAGSRALQRA